MSSQPDNPFASPMTRSEAPAGTMSEHGELATKTSRLLAILIDGSIATIASIPLLFLFFGVFLISKSSASGFMNIFENITAYQVSHPFLYPLVSSAIGLLLYVIIHGYFLAKSGQSLGKKVMNIKIIRTNGELATLGHLVGFRLFIPQIIAIIPYIGTVIALIGILLIFRESRRCLHDEIADTMVVKA